MTAAPLERENVAASAFSAATDGQLKNRWATRLDRASEWLNPILVKESRQALKSRQFVITFTIMLLVTWIATIVAVTSLWPSIYYLPYGSYLLSTYSIILALPLVLVVPFSAFRSLAVEREDGTFELVSVTALTARQIITGKLGSAFAQIMVYCSAIAPCLAFTYLLRGVDLIRILFVIFWTVAISAGLCCLCLLAATFARARYMQTFLSVGIIFMLILVGWFWLIGILSVTITGDSVPWGNHNFWALMGYLFTMLVCFSVTCVLAAAAQISFASDNHATPVRVALFFTQWIATGGFVYLVCLFKEAQAIIAFSTLACLFWAVAGSLMIGDSGFISERVRRQLPASLFGRALFSWFNPGSGTAYVFTCVTMGTGVGAAILFCMLASGNGVFGIRSRFIPDFRFFNASVLALLYVVAYLGAAHLIIAALRRYVSITPVLSFVVAIFVGMAACLIPLMVGIAMDSNLVPSYTPIQAPNWIWTYIECMDHDVHPEIIIIVVTYAVPIFVVNVLLAYREIAATRTAVPTRVLEENRLLIPSKETKPEPQNPWDEIERS